MAKPIHNVFTVAYNGIARELCTQATILDPISGKSTGLTRVIWDTGATASALNMNVISNLGLTPTGQIQVHTANGTTICATFLINLILPNGLTVQSLNVSGGNLGPNTEMLVGMDVISAGDFTVQNLNGKTHFSFCYPPFENKYDMLQKANTLNPKHLKHNSKLKP